jgi:cytosine deaminase
MTIGMPARLIVFNARTINELISRAQSDRAIILNGEKLAARAPDYSELWEEDKP